MFLSLLSQNEKENFMELAFYVAHCDKNFHKEEKKLLNLYRAEMNLFDYEIQNKTLDAIIEDFEDSTFISKTSMLLEIVALTLADLEYDGEEQKILKNLREKWNINDNQFVEIVSWLKDKDVILKTEGL